MIHNQNIDKFKGVFSLVLTPFLPDGEINWPVYDSYVDWQLSKQPTGLFAVCGSSEMKLLTQQERIALAARAVKRAGSTPVVATANVEENIADHYEELMRITDTGVSGVILVPPVGMGMDQARLGEYFADLSDKSPCPVFLYEFPGSNPGTVDPTVYKNLVRNHGVCGIKDTTSTLEGIQAKIDAAPESIVYQANTPFMLDSLRNGAQGIMAITSAGCSQLVVELWNMVKSNDPAAKFIHQHLVMLDAVLGFGYVATAKYLLMLQGIEMGIKTRSQSIFTQNAAKAVEIWYEQLDDKYKI